MRAVPLPPTPTVLLAALALLACACTSFDGHPVRLSRPRLSGAPPPADPTLPEPGRPTDAESERNLFLGVEGLVAQVSRLRVQPLEDPRKPLLASFPSLEASVRKRYSRGGFGGPVLHVVAVGATGHVPLAPREMAALVMNPEVERQVLAADAFRRFQVDFAMPGALRVRNRVELLRQGFGPFRHDLRFTLISEQRDLANGRIWIRSDPGALPRAENVTLYRGACLIEPEAGGSRMTEILLLGTSIRVPGFLTNGLRQLVQTTLSNRANNLWVRAWR